MSAAASVLPGDERVPCLSDDESLCGRGSDESRVAAASRERVWLLSESSRAVPPDQHQLEESSRSMLADLENCGQFKRVTLCIRFRREFTPNTICNPFVFSQYKLYSRHYNRRARPVPRREHRTTCTAHSRHGC